MRQIFLFFMFALVFGGCGNDSSQTGPASSSGVSANSSRTSTFRVLIPTSNPQVLGQAQAIDRVTITFVREGQTVLSGEAPVGLGQTEVQFIFRTLNPGQYTVRADGFSGSQLVATDSQDMTLASNVPTTVRLVLRFIQALTVSPPSVTLTPGSTLQLTASSIRARLSG